MTSPLPFHMRLVAVTVAMTAALVLVGTSLSSAASATSSTSCAPPFGNYDFSAYAGKDQQANGTDTIYTYWINICGVLQSQPTCTDIKPSTSVCWVWPGGNQSYDVGEWVSSQPPIWSYIDDNPSLGVQYQINSTNPGCFWHGAPELYTSIIQFTCSEVDGPISSSGWKTCVKTWTVPTPAACVNSKYEQLAQHRTEEDDELTKPEGSIF